MTTTYFRLSLMRELCRTIEKECKETAFKVYEGGAVDEQELGQLFLRVGTLASIQGDLISELLDQGES